MAQLDILNTDINFKITLVARIKRMNTQKSKPQITNSQKETRKVFFRKYKYQALIVTIITVTLSIAFASQNTDERGSAIYLIILGLVIIGYWYGKAQKQAHSEFMKQFAISKGYSYAESSLTENRSGIIFGIGHGAKIEDYIYGNINNLKTEIFNYNYTIGSGRNRREYLFTVLTITIREELPRLFLDARSNGKGVSNYSSLDVFNPYQGLKKLELEGDFNKYFTLRVKPGDERHALEFFTPDVMAKLVDYSTIFDLEFNNQQILLYASKELNSITQLEQLHTVATILVDELKRKLVSDYN